MSKENKSIVRSIFEQVWNRGNSVAAKEHYAADYIAHTENGDFHGSREFIHYLSEFRRSFPDLQFTIEDVISEGDRVVIRWTGRGTHKAEFQGIAPTGEQCRVTGITLFRIANGKIVEDWGNWDRLGLMQQLDAVPVP